ncbi:two-component sensor histidine kinase [Arthrobacter sp. PGP41]|uniref:sensor histidine kinase n=1 Tax=unclassified Arthrobacter TaxID=235627 RepID=UPI000CDC85B7|nr:MULTISPECIES: sensor histidine kinase [unclassified Arthrobacter]AUZ33730.1 two-component sensor histidine kinase [Arthrobacter sp. PGP41]MDT0195467.1 HAMP domain-containing sensor histidine kinase [Arthrobacter sp. AB6]
MTAPVAWASGKLRFFRRPFHEYSLTQRVGLSQMPLFITTLLTVFLVWAFFPGTMDNPLFAAFVISQLAIMGLCYLVPWERLPYTSFLVIPLLDFVSIGVGRQGGQESLAGITLLAVFPVIWLCASGYYPRAALWLSFLGPLAIIWVPLLLKGNFSPQDLARSLLVPVIVLGIGTSVSVLTLSMMRQQRELEEKDAQLQANLRTSQRQEALLNTVLDTVHLGVLAVDADGHDVLMNRKQRANHELARPKEIADPNESQLLVFGPDRKTLVPVEERPVRRAVLGETFTDYLVWLGAGSDQRAVVTTARAMKDHDGAFAGSVVAFSDVTDLVNALTAKDDFVASVSHEFRTPLTSILGYVELLLADKPTEAQRQMLEILRRNSERLLTLVSDLLSSRNGQLIVTPEAVDVAELVRSSVSSATPRATDAGVALQAQTPERLEAHVDGARISQVLDNLVSNAIKYSPDGGSVLVSLEQEDGHLACRITDTGMGMSPEDASEVFAKFFRSSTVRRTAIPGVGLGLPISKAIIEAHGGTIGVDSTLGEGTTFTFRVPV